MHESSEESSDISAKQDVIKSSAKDETQGDSNIPSHPDIRPASSGCVLLIFALIIGTTFTSLAMRFFS